MSKKFWVRFFALFSGLALSFLSFGILWAGVNQWVQAVAVVLFFAVGFAAARLSATDKVAPALVLLGASPLGQILMMFRDKQDSHLFGIGLVLSWVVAVAAGAFCSGRIKGSS